MVEEFLKSVLDGVEKLGWSSSKKIAEETSWAVEEVAEALGKLHETSRIQMRKKGRGFQYGPLVEKEKVETKSKKEKKVSTYPAVPASPADTVFPSFDTFLLESINALPKEKPYSANDLATALLDFYPDAKSKWKVSEVVDGIGKLVRLQRLELSPYVEGASLKYQYIVR